MFDLETLTIYLFDLEAMTNTSGPHPSLSIIQSNSMIRSSSCRWQEKDQHLEEVGYHHFFQIMIRSWSRFDMAWLGFGRFGHSKKPSTHKHDHAHVHDDYVDDGGAAADDADAVMMMRRRRNPHPPCPVSMNRGPRPTDGLNTIPPWGCYCRSSSLTPLISHV